MKYRAEVVICDSDTLFSWFESDKPSYKEAASMITRIPGGIASGFKDRKQVDTYYFSMNCGLFVRVSYKVKTVGR